MTSRDIAASSSSTDPRIVSAYAVLYGLLGGVQAALLARQVPLAEEPVRTAAFYLAALLIYALGLGLPLALLARLARTSRLVHAIGLGLALAALLPLVMPRAPVRRPFPTTSESSRDRPSVLLVTIDTLRRDHVSAYGGGAVSTPTMNSIAAEGALFEQATCQAPLTTPSHASLLTALIPPRHGSRYNGVRAAVTAAGLAPILRRHGYDTAAFVSASVLTAAMSGLDRGFRIYDEEMLPDPVSQRIYLLPPVRIALDRLGRMTPERRARVAIERVLAYLAEALHRDHPLFLWVHLYDPHIPYDPPRRFARQADPEYRGSFRPDLRSAVALREGKLVASERDLDHGRRLYAAEVAYVESCLASLLRAVRASGRPFVTVLTSDHGESLGEHGYTFFHGENLYGPSMKVPLLMSGPGVRGGSRIPGLVRLVDVMPTILDLLGIAVPAGLDGRSLLPLLRGEALPSVASYGEDGDTLALSPSRALSLRNKDVGLRTEERSYVIRPSRGDEQLYDLAADPGETRNLADDASYAYEKAGMRAKLMTLTDFRSYLDATPLVIDDPAMRKALEQLGYIASPPRAETPPP